MASPSSSAAAARASRRWPALVVPLRRGADDHPGSDHRERGPAVHPERSPFLAVKPRLGRERLPDRVRWHLAAGRTARRSYRTQAHLHKRPGRVHRGLAPVWPVGKSVAADRGPVRAGGRWRHELRCALGMIVTMFSEPREQAKAIGIYSFIASAGASIGLLAGGLLTQGISWHWIFFVNLPIGIAAGVLSLRLVESDRGIGLGGGADVAGAFLVTTSLMLSVYTIVQTAEYGWGSAYTLGFGAVATVLLAGFVARQATAANPLLPLRMFRSRSISGANLIQFLMVAGMLGFFFLSTLYLRRVLGLHPLAIGLAFLPVAVAIGTLSLGWSARLNA